MADWTEVVLILKDAPARGRLEKNPNAMFTHRVRVTEPGQLDGELAGWLREAYDRH